MRACRYWVLCVESMAVLGVESMWYWVLCVESMAVLGVESMAVLGVAC